MFQKYITKVKQNDFWRKLIKNVVAVLIGNGGSSAINLVVTVIMTRTLGSTSYGIFLIALRYMNLLDGIFNFQSWVGVIKYGSEAIVEKNEQKLAAIYKGGYIIDILTALIGTFVAMIILPAVASIMKWDNNLVSLALLFSSEILFHIEGTSIGILRLYDKFSLTAKQAIISAVVKLVLVGGYLLAGGRSIVIVSLLYVITDIIKHLILVLMALIVLKTKMGLHTVAGASLKKLDKKFFKYTIWNNVTYTVDVPVKYFDVFIISFISVEMVAIYKVFKQILQVLSMLIQPIAQAILPQLSELVAMNKVKDALNKVLKLKNAILLLGVFSIIISLLLGKVLFTQIFGVEYGDNILLFEALLITQVGLMSFTAIHPFFASLGVAELDFAYTALTNIVYIFISFGLVKYLGIYAIILATAIQGGSLIYLKYRYACKHFVNKKIE